MSCCLMCGNPHNREWSDAYELIIFLLALFPFCVAVCILFPFSLVTEIDLVI